MKTETAVTWNGSRQVRMMMIGMLMTLLATIGVSAWAQQPPPAPPPPAPPGMGMQGHGGPGGMHGGEHGMRGGMDGGMGPGMMFRGSPARMGRMIDYMLDGLNPTEAQRSQIKQLAAQAATDMKAQADAGKSLRQRGMQIFTAPTVDAAATEQLRQEMLAQHDQMSKRATQAMLAIANVLTPAQRATLGQRFQDRQAQNEDRMKRMQDRRKDMTSDTPRR